MIIYDVTNENGSSITNIDLSNSNVKVKITITAVKTSTKLTGNTNPIEKKLPRATKQTIT